MRLGTTINEVSFSKNGEVWYRFPTINKDWVRTNDPEQVRVLQEIKEIFRKSSTEDPKSQETKLTYKIAELERIINGSDIPEEERKALLKATSKTMDFFSEFAFEPNFRFMNTFARICYESGETAAVNYIMNYFELADSAYTEAIREKVKCIEFKEIMKIFSSRSLAPKTKVNDRLKIYYGSQGTGKTTEALKESEGRCMVCHSAMLPSDLMEDFKFDDGKAAFTPSALYKAMEEGQTIVLDEINLLPFESLRFLQSITDGKESFIYKGRKIEIKNGFKIIGTMNLVVNGNTYSLPEPLIDRCECLRKFSLYPEALLEGVL